jgi:hypothetical protein
MKTLSIREAREDLPLNRGVRPEDRTEIYSDHEHAIS